VNGPIAANKLNEMVSGRRTDILNRAAGLAELETSNVESHTEVRHGNDTVVYSWRKEAGMGVVPEVVPEDVRELPPGTTPRGGSRWHGITRNHPPWEPPKRL
jgi:hypothetical protein